MAWMFDRGCSLSIENMPSSASTTSNNHHYHHLSLASSSPAPLSQSPLLPKAFPPEIYLSSSAASPSDALLSQRARFSGAASQIPTLPSHAITSATTITATQNRLKTAAESARALRCPTPNLPFLPISHHQLPSWTCHPPCSPSRARASRRLNRRSLARSTSTAARGNRRQICSAWQSAPG